MSGAHAPAWSSVPAVELASVHIATSEFAADPFGFWQRYHPSAHRADA
jgi:hypothetical protein